MCKDKHVPLSRKPNMESLNNNLVHVLKWIKSV
jgi:hypothetical protein